MPQDLVSGTGGLASAQTEYDKRGYPDTLLSRGMTAWGGGPQLCAVLKDPSENCSNDHAEKFKSCIFKKWMLGTFKISRLSSLCRGWEKYQGEGHFGEKTWYLSLKLGHQCSPSFRSKAETWGWHWCWCLYIKEELLGSLRVLIWR